MFVRDKETGGCWRARGDLTACVRICARGGFMSQGETRACRAGGLHHGRPNAKGRDMSEQKNGVTLISVQRPRWERENNAQATTTSCLTATVSKLDARFATRCKEFGFASGRKDAPPAPTVGQCHPCLHKKSFSFSPQANTST